MRIFEGLGCGSLKPEWESMRCHHVIKPGQELPLMHLADAARTLHADFDATFALANGCSINSLEALRILIS